MKAKLIPEISWSNWFQDEFGSWFCHLHHWRELTHIHKHNVQIARYVGKDKYGITKTLYEAKVEAGPWGKTSYLFETYDNAKTARLEAEKAVLRALSNGALEI